MEVKELLNKNLADVAKSNPNGDMWFFQDPKLKGWYLDDEEKDGNFSYWDLYNSDDEHTGTISVEDGVITQLPRNLSENNHKSNGVHINGKKVNVKSIEIDGVDRRDSPDFVDAYISYAEYEDGTELSDAELDELGGDGELVNELIFDRQLYLEENSKLNEAIEGGLTFDELPDKIKDYFRRNITMSVAFVKKDGSVRHMAFRRNLKSYEKSDKEKSDRQANVLSNNNLMNVYDTNSFIRLKRETGDAAQAAKGSFRNFKLDNVLAFLVGGQLFDMRDQNKIEERFGEEIYAALTPSMISALKSDEAKGLEDVPPYEGPEDPMDNQVTEVMIQEGELGKAIARILKEEMFKK